MTERNNIIAHIEGKIAALRNQSNAGDDWAAHSAAVLVGVVDDIRAGLHEGDGK